MSFLAPLFLFGAAAIALPVILHLIRRTTRDVTPFSSLMFLQPTPPRVTRRSRLENIWLLLLRCTAIALLAAAFARPWWRREGAPAKESAMSGRRAVVLLDTSASMRREGLWDQARAAVERVIRDASPEDEVAVIAFDSGTRTLATLAEWKQMPASERAASVLARLREIAPGWQATRLDTALLDAAEMVAQNDTGAETRGEIIVVSDLQEGARLDALQGYQWPPGVHVVLQPANARAAANASIHWLAQAAENEPRLRIVNSAESPREKFDVQWDGGSMRDAIEAYVPAGQSRTIRAARPEYVTSDRLTLAGDDTDFDNTLFVLPPRPPRLPVIFIGDETAADSRGTLFYLGRAFHKTPQAEIELLVRPTDQPLAPNELDQARLLILGDGARDRALESARQFARNGRIVLLPLTSAASGQTLGQLLEITPLSPVEAPVQNYAMLGEIDFQHPIFAPFADPRFSDFTKIHFWKYRRFDPAKLPGARVLARFDSGDPALVQAPLGKGSVVVLTSSWKPADSQLALSSKFVPLLHALLAQSSGATGHRPQYFIGDEVPLHAAARQTVRKPDGREIAVAPGATFRETDQPGVYSLMPDGGRFAVNLAPEESRIGPLPIARLIALGVPLQSEQPPEPSPQEKELAAAAEVEGRQKYWRWLIAAVVVLLLGETLLAGRLTRPAAATQT